MLQRRACSGLDRSEPSREVVCALVTCRHRRGRLREGALDLIDLRLHPLQRIQDLLHVPLHGHVLS